MPFEHKTIKFAVIGCGHIGKRYCTMIQQNSDTQLSAVVDIKSLETLDFDLKGISFFKTIDDFLKEEIPTDVVVIATPNGLHAEHAIQCLKAGKHVVVEKPMTLTRQDAQHIIDTAKEVNRPIFAVMQNRYSPPSVWLKNLMEEQRLGAIYMVQINCYWNRDDRYYKKGDWHGTKDLDGGTLFTQFSHFIDLMYWCFGDIKNIQARFKDFAHAHSTDFEDSGFVTFDFVKGGIGSFNFSTAVWDKNMESSITVIGEKGSLKIAGQYMNSVEYCHIKDYVMPELPPVNPPNDYGAYKGSAANHHYIIDNVVQVLRGNNRITTTAEEGLKVVDIIERMYAAFTP